MKSPLEWVVLFLKGALMGAADIVPGVSGGTVAFITGIYQRLLHAISSVSWSLVAVLRQEGWRAAWQALDGTFLTVLAMGVVASIVSLAKGISWLLKSYPEPLWAFFFGLILASAWFLFRGLLYARHANWLKLGAVMLVGVIFALLLTEIAPVEMDPQPVVLFFAGAIAICAMILPGISGSFMLLLMGLYGPVLEAIKSFELGVLAVFAAGCLVGLLSFARLLNWLFNRFHYEVVACLVGVMIGSLNKVWPWKETLTVRINSHGESVPLLQSNLLPMDYLTVTGQEPRMGLAIVLMLLGVTVVLGLGKLAQMNEQGK